MLQGIFDYLNLPKYTENNPQFYAFLKRIEKQRLQPLPPALNSRIERKDLQRILNAFPSFKLSTFLVAIGKLQPNRGLRLEKGQTGLPRTLTVLRKVNGEYLLMLETKSKLKDGTKIYNLPEAEEDPENKLGVCGAFKCGKTAWRIDVFEKDFDLVTRLKHVKADLAKLKQEVALSQKYDPTYFCHLILGPRYRSVNHPEQEKISVYAKEGKSLDNLIDSKDILKLSKKQKNKIIHNILQGLKILHADGNVHQDLKPNNIIVYENDHCKLNDLGILAEHDTQKWLPLAAAEYQSPEIAYYYSQSPDIKNYEYFMARPDCLGFQQQNFCAGDKSHYARPNKANDMWALGITVFEIKYGRWPENNKQDLHLIDKNPLLRGLLQPQRHLRVDIDAAIKIFTRSTLPLSRSTLASR